MPRNCIIASTHQFLVLVSLADNRPSAAAWPASPHQFHVLVSLADNHSSAAAWPVSAQLFCLQVSPAVYSISLYAA